MSPAVAAAAPAASSDPLLLALAAVGGLVLAACAMVLAALLAALLIDAVRSLRARAGRGDPGLAAARADWYAEVDRVAVVDQLGDEVSANVFPLPRRAAAEVVPFPSRPAA
jgi:hypothetical protein